MTDTANVNYMEDEKLQKEIVAKVKELREADPKPVSYTHLFFE